MEDATPTMKENEEPAQHHLPQRNLKSTNLIEEDKKIESKEESEKFTDHSNSHVAKLESQP
jgi:hypothetical protein